MAKKPPVVSAGRVYGAPEAEAGILLDSPAWFGWLALPDVRSFSYPIFAPRLGYVVGYATVRKERRTRGGEYWVAYRRAGSRLQKCYLGNTAAVTHARQEQLAAQWRPDEDDPRSGPGGLPD